MLTIVYVLQHVHTHDDGGEDAKLIGVYSSRDSARAAIARLSKAPGFSGAPLLVDPLKDDRTDGFHIDEYQLDKDQWAEGFATVAHV